MARVTTTASVNIEVTDGEWRLIMKALAVVAGVNIKLKRDEIAQAEALNKSLLEQRLQTLREQVSAAEKAAAKAEAPQTFTTIPMAE